MLCKPVYISQTQCKRNLTSVSLCVSCDLPQAPVVSFWGKSANQEWHPLAGAKTSQPIFMPGGDISWPGWGRRAEVSGKVSQHVHQSFSKKGPLFLSNLIDVPINLTTTGLWERLYSPSGMCLCRISGTDFPGTPLLPFHVSSRLSHLRLLVLAKWAYRNGTEVETRNMIAWRNDKLLYHKKLASLTSSAMLRWIQGEELGSREVERRLNIATTMNLPT